MPDLLLDPHEPDERLERWLDGDLPADEAERVAEAVQRYPAWAQAARAARTVQRVLGSTQAPVAPRAFTASVLREVARREREARTPLAERFRAWMPVPVWQPALAALIVLLVAVAVWSRPAPPSDAEVAVAVEDVQWTLAFLSHTSEKTGLLVRDRVVVPHVVVPVREALETSLQEEN